MFLDILYKKICWSCMLIGLFGLIQSSLSIESIKPSNPIYTRDIDDHVYYAVIHPFHDEWNTLVNRSDLAPAPIHFWMRCLDHQVRGYVFIEHLHHLDHGKEAYTPSSGIIGDKFQLTADGKKITVENWLGGTNIYFDIPKETSEDHLIDIQLSGIKHYTRFPVSKCQISKPLNINTKYIMHVHLNDYRKTTEMHTNIVQGIANHFYFHRCTVFLDHYELVIYKNQLKFFLQNEYIRQAAEKGLITFILRNPVIPGPIIMNPGRQMDCYWQAYTENMALMRHWKENVRMYFFDSDEYIMLNETITKEDYIKKLHDEPASGFIRFMIFRHPKQTKEVPKDLNLLPFSHDYDHHGFHGDFQDLTFNYRHYDMIPARLNDPKLVVDPNKVGCYIVHWAGCGAPTKELDSNKFGYIVHFENMYHPRWNRPNIEHFKPVPFNNTKNAMVCDPSLVLTHDLTKSYF